MLTTSLLYSSHQPSIQVVVGVLVCVGQSWMMFANDWAYDRSRVPFGPPRFDSSFSPLLLSHGFFWRCHMLACFVSYFAPARAVRVTAISPLGSRTGGARERNNTVAISARCIFGSSLPSIRVDACVSISFSFCREGHL